MRTCSECGQAKPESAYRKHSTGHTMRYCNECHLAKQRAQYAAKRDERNAQRRARYAGNVNGMRDKYIAARKEKYAREGRSSLKKWEDENPEKVAAAHRKKIKRYREQLSDYYVRRLLTHPQRSLIREVPAVLIELKRLQLLIERECREQR